MTDEPLIYTSKGNVPISSLTYEHKWVQMEDQIWLYEEWRDASGEIVKNNAHGLRLTGQSMGGQQAVMQ